MESAVKVYLAIHRLVHWTSWKTIGFQARLKTEFETGPRQMELLSTLSGNQAIKQSNYPQKKLANIIC
ncbi:hypothetical protein [Companilactobacillus sp. HBUAS59699]|uniref:hypothetical protein n=1 Tax=Companilactobacillus sp. HBUAS59699 TaxID=3109358 RepID=UPI002FF42B2C